MSDTKQFHISDVLSISTGRLVSTRLMDGIYDILNWMTGESVYTHQIPAAMRECQPELFKQFPALSEVRLPDDPSTLKDIDVRQAWLTEQAKTLGSHMAIARMEREPRYDTPIADAIEIMGDPTKSNGNRPMSDPIKSPAPLSEALDESVSGEERDIAIVKALRHRVDGGRHSCKCDECRAIKQVCGLATEALAMKASRRKSHVR